MPFGPDISWPNGFRRMDPAARNLLEGGFGGSPQGRPDAGPGTGGSRPGYLQSATDDYGYGDPGYSDPAYDGPRGGSGGAARPGGAPAGYRGTPGYQGTDFREPARQYHPGYQPGSASGGYPATGAQQPLAATGPQPAADRSTSREPGAGPAYPEQWYGHPRLDDPRPASDPRLAGMRYDELRYEEPPAGEPGYDEPLDDESWYTELGRSAPSYPQQPDGRPAGDQRGGDIRGLGDTGGLGYGQRPGTTPSGGFPAAPGYGPGGGAGLQGRRDPRMGAGVEAGPGTGAARQDPAGYLGAPTAQVGVLAPPATRRLEEPAEYEPAEYQPAEHGPAATGPQRALPGASQVLAPAVRPGHGLDGPEITSSWPAQPQAEEADSFAEFWAEDDDDDYTGLFPGEDGDSGRRTRGTARRTGRRRGRSNDHRLWLALGGVLVTAVAAIVGILKFELPSHSGPVHTMVTPAKIGSYLRTVDMERQTNVSQLRNEVIKMSSGQASDVKSAVYESGNSAAGNTEQIVMFIGGHLANAAPASSIGSFRQNFANAAVVSAGSLGGQAACVQEAGGTSQAVAMCVWFDNDSFGEIVSPTMNASALAQVMRTMRPSVELVAKK